MTKACRWWTFAIERLRRTESNVHEVLVSGSTTQRSFLNGIGNLVAR